MNTLKINYTEILNPRFNLRAALTRAAIKGYVFCPDAISQKACEAMKEEAERLQFEVGDYVAKPIREYKKTKVTQAHERAYYAVSDWRIPVATQISSAIIRQVAKVVSRLPTTDDPLSALMDWAPTEAGYQRYRTTSHHISPHRDRRTDCLLGATVTIDGSAPVRIHKPLGDPEDYTNLEVIDEFKAASGGLMLLRAHGLGGGEQVIHEVLPPITNDRLILNLRMRPDILKAPSEEI